MNIDFGWSNKNPKKPVDADELKRLASIGRKRQEISKAMGRPNASFWKSVNDSESLTNAYNEGVAMAQEKLKN